MKRQSTWLRVAIMGALGATAAGVWFALRRADRGLYGAWGFPPPDPAEIPRSQREALRKAVAAAGGWDSDDACRRFLGKPPPRTWDSTRRVAKEVARAAGVDFGALDPGSQALIDEFCSHLKLGGRCPAGQRGAWLQALVIALGRGGKRTYRGLSRSPAWRALTEAFEAETGRPLPLPPGAIALDDYRDRYDGCVDNHENHVAALVADARTGELLPPAPF